MTQIHYNIDVHRGVWWPLCIVYLWHHDLGLPCMSIHTLRFEQTELNKTACQTFTAIHIEFSSKSLACIHHYKKFDAVYTHYTDSVYTKWLGSCYQYVSQI